MTIKKGEIWQPLYVGGKWEELLKLPATALKVWLLHYSMEGKGKRRSWPTIETIMEKCDLSHNTVHIARKWLIANKWLVLVGYTEFGVPMYRVEKGTLPPKSGSTKKREGKTKKLGVPPSQKLGAKRGQYNQEPPEPVATGTLVSQPVSEGGTLLTPEQKPPFYSERIKRSIDLDDQDVATQFYLELIPHGLPTEENVIATFELLMDLPQEYLRGFWSWNRSHKTGGLRFTSIQHMAKALESKSENSAAMQYADHRSGDCPRCKKSKGQTA